MTAATLQSQPLTEILDALGTEGFDVTTPKDLTHTPRQNIAVYLRRESDDATFTVEWLNGQPIVTGRRRNSSVVEGAIFNLSDQLLEPIPQLEEVSGPAFWDDATIQALTPVVVALQKY